ncbi:hypothetical protein BGZ65_006224 [Modicella reniformis]|uniref:Rho-GAP domain-containing protein n=1 Tax=Modicella reniformis TaxID=1440133 RepID=A0A9P6INE6_9FUNG|nr:hypothetical protein BGZ65_006224 [Modicella reniformis]
MGILFYSMIDISDYNEKLYTIKSLVHALPEPNFNTLQYLMSHLGRVQDQYHTTKMDSANLAICFAPNLLRQEVDDLTSIINTGKQSSIVDTLIEQREWVFDPYPEDDEDDDAVDQVEPAEEQEEQEEEEEEEEEEEKEEKEEKGLGQEPAQHLEYTGEDHQQGTVDRKEQDLHRSHEEHGEVNKRFGSLIKYGIYVQHAFF